MFNQFIVLLFPELRLLLGINQLFLLLGSQYLNLFLSLFDEIFVPLVPHYGLIRRLFELLSEFTDLLDLWRDLLVNDYLLGVDLLF